MSDEQRDELIERAMRGVRGLETHTPHGYDPASDDMTVEFAIKLSEQDAEIATLRAALDRAEAEKADFRRLDDAGYAEIAHLRAELAAAKQYGIDCLSAACVTHQSELASAQERIKHMEGVLLDAEELLGVEETGELITRPIARLQAELAAVRETLVKTNNHLAKLVNGAGDNDDGEPIQEVWEAARQQVLATYTALQSHRRTEEAT